MLEHEADAALLRRERGRVLAGDQRPCRASGFSRPAITRSSVDLPLPLGPSSAVSDAVRHLDRDVVERDEVAEALVDVLDLDAHWPSGGPPRAWSSERSSTQRASAERHQREHDRCRVGARRGRTAGSGSRRTAVSGLGLARDLSRHHAHRAELAQRPRGREHDAVRRRPSGSTAASRARRSASATRPASRRPAPARRRSLRAPASTSRTTNGSETKIVARTMPGHREDHLDPVLGRASRRTSRRAP